MSGALKRVLGAMRHNSAAFAFLIAQIAFGTAVVTHALVLTALFERERGLRGMDLDGTFSIAVEGDDVTAARRDLAALQRLPGVRAAAWSARAPIVQRLGGDFLTGNGRKVPTWSAYGTGSLAAASGFQLVAGRALADDDASANAVRPILITAALARALFDSSTAVGQVVESPALGLRYRIVGVLGEASVVPSIDPNSANLTVHAALPPPARHAEYLVNVGPEGRAGFARAASAALRRPERFVRVEPIRDTLIREFPQRNGTLFIFAVMITLVLGVVLLGVTGMSSFLVAERLREIGVRRALGARRVDIRIWFLFENLAVTTLGLAIGAGLTWLLNRTLVIRAVPSAALDIRYLLLAMILFWVTGLLAASRPAARAARVAPAVASRTA